MIARFSRFRPDIVRTQNRASGHASADTMGVSTITIRKFTLICATALLATASANAQNGCYYEFCSIAGPCRQVCPQ
jgi:hypothetical protein